MITPLNQSFNHSLTSTIILNDMLQITGCVGHGTLHEFLYSNNNNSNYVELCC